MKFPASFFENHYRISPALLKKVHAYSNSQEAIDQYLFDCPFTHPSLSIYMNGERKDESAYFESYFESKTQSKRINVARLKNLLEEGASLIFNRMNAHSLPMAKICHDLQLDIQEKLHAHGYFSQKDQESLGFHWDTNDVFAVQLIGRKRWIIKKPTIEIPLPSQINGAEDKSPEDIYLDVVTEPGDVLYLPGGWWHTALPLHQPTFHLAIGVQTKKTMHFLDWIMKAKMPDLLECRTDADIFKNNKEKYTDQILQTLRSHLLDERLFVQFNQSFDSPAQQKSLINIGDTISQLGDADVISLAFPQLWKSTELVNGNITLNGITFSLKEEEISVLTHIQNKRIVHVGDVLDIYGNSTLNTLRDLYRNGLLTKCEYDNPSNPAYNSNV